MYFDEQACVRCADGRDAEAWRMVLATPPLMPGNTGGMLVPKEIVALHALLRRSGEVSIGGLMQGMAASRRDALMRSLAWLLKAGLIAMDGRVQVSPCDAQRPAQSQRKR